MTGPIVHGAELAPGDLLICDGTADTSKLIEVGAILVGDPAASHVCGYHHTDANGIPWGIEGRPGGVGWRDIRDYDRDPRTVTNAAQPKTGTQRQIITEWGVKLLHTAYDWKGGIAQDADAALGLPPLPWHEDATGKVPGHAVCSSLWAWIYSWRAMIPAPKPPAQWETTTPGMWSEFVAERGWEHIA